MKSRILGCAAALALWACDDEAPTAVADAGDQMVAEAGPSDLGPLTDSGPDAAADGGVPDGAPADLGPEDGAVPVDRGPDMAAEPRCGDGQVDDGEACDDGNQADGDGCDAACRWEPQVAVEPDGRDQPLVLRFDERGVAQATFALEGPMDLDWFQFELPAASDVSIVVQSADEGAPCPGDPALSLFTEEAAPVLTVEDGLTTICPVAAPGTHPRLTGLEAGIWTVRVSPSQDPIPNLRIVVRQLPRLPDEAACREDGATGLCTEPARCGRTDLETQAGICVPRGCGDWLRDDGEACDAPEAFCTEECALAGAAEVEPNDTPVQANRLGESLVPGLGDWQIATTLAALDDRDHFKVTLPAGLVDVYVQVFDGFLFCPGAVRATVTDEAGAVIGRTDFGCEGLRLPPMPGEQTLGIRLSTDDVGVPGQPMLLFARTVARVGEGEACSAVGFPNCVPGTWCVQAACVPDVCGDGRVGPAEGCDDGNLAPGDGCDAECRVEVQPIDPPGGDFPLRVPAGEPLRFTFSLFAPGAEVTLETLGRDGVCPADTRLRLLGPEGLVAEVDDLEDGGLCAALTVVLPGGPYEVLLDHRDDDVVDDLVLRVTYGEVSDEGAPCGEAAPPCVDGTFCLDGTCRGHRCGDGIFGPGEECDDGNQLDDDGCSAACRFEAEPVGQGGDFQREAVPFDEADVFGFEIDEPRRLRAWIDNGRGRCTGDTGMDLERFEDGEWRMVTTDDDGGVTICSRIDRPVAAGRYQLVVYGVDDDLPAYVMHVRVQAQQAPGAACDPLGDADACTPGHACQPAADGGTCVALATARQEQEPDNFSEDVMPVAPDVAVRSRLDDAFGADALDLFAFELAVPGRLRVETGDGDGGCPGDTILHRVDPALWDAEDPDTAIQAALATSDDTDNLRCSVLEEDLDAGVHWYAVEEFSRDEALSYTVLARVLPVRAEGEACHAVLRNPWDVPWFDRCAEGLACVAEPGAAQGTCQGQ